MPPALYRTGGDLCPGRGVSVQGGLSGDLCLGGLCPGGSLSREEPPPSPPVDRQTPVKILPCPKLRLRAVIRSRSVGGTGRELLGTSRLTVHRPQPHEAKYGYRSRPTGPWLVSGSAAPLDCLLLL